MKKHFIILLAVSVFTISCSKKAETQIDSEAPVAGTEAKTELLQLKDVATATSNGSSITEVTYADGTATLAHTTNYEEYKKLNPDSRATAERYKSRWDEENDLYYTLNVTPAVILKDLSFVDHVITKVTYTDRKVYCTDVTRKDLQAFMGGPVESDANNEKSFSGRYVWDKSGRESFFDKFGTIK